MNPFPYEDIVHLPHHVSKTRPQMSMHDRAAQFAPFAALNTHSEHLGDVAKQHLEMMLTEDVVPVDTKT